MSVIRPAGVLLAFVVAFCLSALVQYSASAQAVVPVSQEVSVHEVFTDTEGVSSASVEVSPPPSTVEETILSVGPGYVKYASVRSVFWELSCRADNEEDWEFKKSIVSHTLYVSQLECASYKVEVRESSYEMELIEEFQYTWEEILIRYILAIQYPRIELSGEMVVGSQVSVTVTHEPGFGFSFESNASASAIVAPEECTLSQSETYACPSGTRIFLITLEGYFENILEVTATAFYGTYTVTTNKRYRVAGNNIYLPLVSR